MSESKVVGPDDLTRGKNPVPFGRTLLTETHVESGHVSKQKWDLRQFQVTVEIYYQDAVQSRTPG